MVKIMSDVEVDFLSFELLLKKYLLLLKPKRILEWGPGRSTELMLQTCKYAHITTIEHDPEWFTKFKDWFRENGNVTVLFLRGSLYWTFPLRGEKHDLVFVDGFCDYRVDCLKTAYQVVTGKGVVILHDSQRSKYDEGKRLFKLVEEEDGTAVMEKP